MIARVRTVAAAASAAAALAVGACGSRDTRITSPVVSSHDESVPPADPPEELRAPRDGDLVRYAAAIPGEGPLIAVIETPLGAITCRLFGDESPVAVAIFVGLATGQKPWRDPSTDTVVRGRPFYTGLTFHRVIPEFMIQGGCPLAVGTGGPGYAFHNEIGNGLAMQPGTLAMANAGPDTNGSQFFITEVTAAHLNGRHTIFGHCDPLDVVKAIARVPHDRWDKPITDVTMTVTIRRQGTSKSATTSL